MDNENRYLELFSQATRLPLALFEGDRLMFEADAAKMQYNLPMYLAASLPPDLPQIWYAETPEGLFFGGLQLPGRSHEGYAKSIAEFSDAAPESEAFYRSPLPDAAAECPSVLPGMASEDDADRSTRLPDAAPQDTAERRLLLLGPAFTGECTRKQAREIMRRLGRRENDAETFLIQAGRIPEISVAQLSALLLLLQNMYYGLISSTVPMIEFTWAPFFPAPKAEVHEIPEENSGFAMEEEMLSLIYYGRVRELRIFFNESVPFHNPDMEEHTKNLELRRSYMYGANMLASRVAIAAGADHDLLNAMAGTHHESLMRATSLSELGRAFNALMLDYAGAVAKLQDAPGNDYLCTKISRYVAAHIYEKLSTSVIAEALGFTAPYVSAHFKEVTGSTLTDFIYKRKIQEAAYLIGSGHYGIGEVSSLLNFSSQSYFTKIFRKYMGVTPEVHRKEGIRPRRQ